MTVKDLQEYLSKFSPDAQVQIWEWNNPNPGDNNHYCQIGCNFDYQQKQCPDFKKWIDPLED